MNTNSLSSSMTAEISQSFDSFNTVTVDDLMCASTITSTSTVDRLMNEVNSEENIKEDLELLSLLRGYLVQCADKILDERPEELVKEIIKLRDNEVQMLKYEIERLKNEVGRLNDEIERLKYNNIPLSPNPNAPYTWPSTTTPPPTWWNVT